MANWADSAPNEATAYTTVLTNLRDRDKDSAKMFSSDPTNPEESFMRYNRAGNKFQEYLSAVWTDKVLAIAGGGTGGATAAAARTALGLGTMAVQNNNAVDIDGGDIASAVTINAASLTAGLVAQARLGSGSGGAGERVLLDNQTWGVSVPVGTGFVWYTAVAPTGFLLCNGAAVSRTTYSALFAVIGITWGPGDGSTTFNLPSLNDRVPIGVNVNAIGTYGGSATHTHTISSESAHTHAGPSHTHGPGTLATGSHNHSFSDTSSNPSNGTGWGTNAGSGGEAANANHTHNVSGTTGSETSLEVTIGVTAAGGTETTGAGSSHTHTISTEFHVPFFTAVNFIIKY